MLLFVIATKSNQKDLGRAYAPQACRADAQAAVSQFASFTNLPVLLNNNRFTTGFVKLF
ncbi:MAG: hypothetical protein ACM3VS_10040 [Candidatus Dadabacteria bacterium]